MSPIPVLPGLSDIVAGYDALILDLWGVVHDGSTAYPGAADTLAALARAGKKTVLLSNAPRRASALVEGMTRMGIARDLYGEVMSSGEAVYTELKTRSDPWYAKLGTRCLHIGPERDLNIFDGLDIELVGVDRAEFVVNTGPDKFEETVEDYRPILEQAAARSLPMVCANPDHLVIREGQAIVCAGALAAAYEKMGRQVSYRGKPDPAIYGKVLELLGIADRSKVLAVGDAFHTDIAGARAAGIDAVLCTGGIHASDLGLKWGDMPDAAKVTALAQHHGLTPVAAIPAFRW